MKFLVWLALPVVFISAGVAAATNTGIAMTLPSYIKWQSSQTADYSGNNNYVGLFDSLSSFLNGKQSNSSFENNLKRSGIDFNIDEIKHLADVRDVFSRIRKTNKISLVLFTAGIGLLVFLKGLSFAIKTIYRVCFVLLILFLLAGLSTYFKFLPAFDQMHKLFFASGTWLFPESSFLLKYFPIDFWENSAKILFAGSVGQVAVLGLISKYLVRKFF